MKTSEYRRRGFTLIEVLLVIGILLVLGTVAVVGYSKIKASSDRDAALVLVKQVCDAIDIYNTRMSTYPSQENGLKDLVQAPAGDEAITAKWNQYGPFLKDGIIPKDPWGQEIQYELVDTGGSSGSSGAALIGPAYHVWSNGLDKQPKTDDDIKSWSDAEAAK